MRLNNLSNKNLCPWSAGEAEERTQGTLRDKLTELSDQTVQWLLSFSFNSFLVVHTLCKSFGQLGLDRVPGGVYPGAGESCE